MFQFAKNIAKQASDFVLPKLNPIFNLPEKRVLMLHNGRCGSTVLGDLLKQHKSINWRGESLNPFLHQIRYDKNLALHQDFLNNKKKLSTIVNRHLNATIKKVSGVELKFYDFDTFIGEENCLEYIRQNINPTHIILLTRTNLLQQVFSHVKAFNTKKWTYLNGEKIDQAKSFYLDTNAIKFDHLSNSLINWFNKFEANYKSIKKIDIPLLEINYEKDIEANPLISVEKVINFLNLEMHKPTVRFKKINKLPLSETIENFSEVKSVLENSSYKSMVENL